MHRFVLPAAVMLVLATACSKQEEAAPPPPPVPPPVAAPAPAAEPLIAPAPAAEPLITPAPQADTQSQQGDTSKSAMIAPGVGAEAGAYTVVKGDTLYKIARKHGVKLSDLVAWNNVKKASRIHPGQKLRLSGR